MKERERGRTTMGTNAHLQFIGEITQICGVIAAVAGVVLSLHHWPTALALIGGGVAFYAGTKLRGSALYRSEQETPATQQHAPKLITWKCGQALPRGGLVSAFPAPEGVSRFAREVPSFWRRGRPGQDESAALGGHLPGGQDRRLRYAASAAHVSGARIVAARLFPPRRSAQVLQELQRVEARRHVAQRLDHALRLLPQRKRRLPVSGRGVSVHRARRADALHVEAVAVPHFAQPLSRAGEFSLHGWSDESGKHRPCLGEGAVGGPCAPARIRAARALRSARL